MSASSRPLSGDPSPTISIANSCAQHTVRPNKLKCWGYEQRKVYCRVNKGDQEVVQALKRLELPWQSIF